MRFRVDSAHAVGHCDTHSYLNRFNTMQNKEPQLLVEFRQLNHQWQRCSWHEGVKPPRLTLGFGIPERVGIAR